MDVLVFGTMKNAAKCDNNCELQNKRNNHDFERKWRAIGVDLFSTEIKWEKKKKISTHFDNFLYKCEDLFWDLFSSRFLEVGE